MNFKEWLINEDGYITFDEPVVADLGDGPETIKMIDLRLELWMSKEPDFKRPSPYGISLKTKDGWINARGTSTMDLGMMFFKGEPEVTPQPKYGEFTPSSRPEDWMKVGLVSGEKNQWVGPNKKTYSIPAIDWDATMWKQNVG